MWCWRRIEKISWIDGERNVALQGENEEGNILHTIKGRKVKWYIVRRNCLLKHVTEGKIEGREKEEGDVSSYWVTLRKRENIGY
jgi:hypothetical protein